jgi:hypothetical protein
VQKWVSINGPPIKIAIDKHDSKLGEEGSRRLVIQAIHMWQAPSCSSVRMDLVSVNESPDIVISFVGRPPTTVACGSKRCEIDTLGNLGVVLHNIGHSLCLGESNVEGAIMHGPSSWSGTELHEDDKAGICSMWPCPANNCTKICVDDECLDGLVCEGGHCVEQPPKECINDEQCGVGMICEERKCIRGCRKDADCGLGMICEDRKCIPGCRKDADCGLGMVCEDRKCIRRCRKDIDCGSGMICEDRKCIPGCRKDADCGLGMICEDRKCIRRCRKDIDCGSGMICEDRKCIPGCRKDADCDPWERCKAFKCIPNLSEKKDASKEDELPSPSIPKGCNCDISTSSGWNYWMFLPVLILFFWTGNFLRSWQLRRGRGKKERIQREMF